jgi:hypothetical protein
MSWISVRHWRRFQHYDPEKRQPPWIKNYTELTRSDEYLSLGASERAILHGIWLEYASSQCALRFDPVLIGRRLNLRVRKQHLVSLCDAGFLDVVASKTLADGYQSASARAYDVEVETEEEETPTPQPVVPTTQQPDLNGLSLLGDEPARILAAAARQAALEDEPL